MRGFTLRLVEIPFFRLDAWVFAMSLVLLMSLYSLRFWVRKMYCEEISPLVAAVGLGAFDVLDSQ